MNSKQRVDAVLSGQTSDRPPFSFWYHFSDDQVAGPAALEAHVNQLERYQMDFLKVMNDDSYPHPGRIERVEELASLKRLRGDEKGFGLQLELLSSLKAAVGTKVYMPTTIFNAWMVLRRLVEPPTAHKPPNLDAAADGPSRWIRNAYAQKPDMVAKAVELIGQNLARFAALCVQAGADGIFLSVRDDWVESSQTQGLYERLVRPADQAILAAVAKAHFNILHVCGKAVNFRAFADYPVAAINWADRAAGPPISEVASWLKPAICGGVDNLGTMVNGSPSQVRAEVADATRQAGRRPIMIAPGCTFDPQKVPHANLEAIAEAVRG